MRLTAAPVLAPVAAGILSAWLVPASAWDGWRSGLLPALSVIAAAVLVRLARGLPFNNADHFELEAFRNVSAAFRSIASSLRLLIIVCLSDMVGIIFEGSILKALDGVSLISLIHQIVDRSVSGLLAFGITYAFVRVLQVVDSDVSLLKTQSVVIEAAISKKNGQRFASAQAREGRPSVVGAESFGRPL